MSRNHYSWYELWANAGWPSPEPERAELLGQQRMDELCQWRIDIQHSSDSFYDRHCRWSPLLEQTFQRLKTHAPAEVQAQVKTNRSFAELQ